MSERWPTISIVTPSYNQGPFIERTIRSVLEQDYPHIEYLVIDGGSTDQTIEILERYSARLAYWVSEPDSGQTHAINKGLKRISGEIFAYLNSDDYYYPGAFRAAAVALRGTSDDERVGRWAVGVGDHVFADGGHSHYWYPNAAFGSDPVLCFVARGLCQHACFWRRQLLDEVGYFDESFQYAMDTEYQLRLVLRGYRPKVIDQLIAAQVLHEDCKTMQGRAPFDRERVRLQEKFATALSPHQWRQVDFLSQVRGALGSYYQRRWGRLLLAAGDLGLRFPFASAEVLGTKLISGRWPWTETTVGRLLDEKQSRSSVDPEL
jgi:glycosyltransferase involved in cell wall biosynthesis